MIGTPKVDWLRSPPRWPCSEPPAWRCSPPCSGRPGSGARSPPSSSSGASSPPVVLGRPSSRPEPRERQVLRTSRCTHDRLAALAGDPGCRAWGAAAVLVSWGEQRRDHVGEYYALLAAAGAGMIFFVGASNLMTLFLGLEWFSISLYILCALDTHRETSLESGLKYLIVGSFGSGILLFGSALVYGATGELGFGAIAQAGSDGDYLLLAGLAMISPDSASRPRRRRSTCGRPTSTRERRPRLLHSCRPPQRSPRSS